MTPTSTERGYRTSLALVLVSLVLLCTVLFALGALQGPKLKAVQLDVDRASSQQVRLVSNQPIAEVDASRVAVTPAVPFTVDTSGNVVAIVFSSALDYGTRYAVTVTGIHGPQRDVESSFVTSFTTRDAEFYYLDRTSEPDRILRSVIGDPRPEVVYQAESITEFARVGTVLAVVTRDANRVDSLSLVQLGATGGVESIALPDDGWVTDVQASDSAQTLGFVFTSVGDNDYSRTLFTIDLTATRELRPAVDLRGDVLHVLDWQFRPHSETLLALDSSRALAVIDPSGLESPLPLGDYLTLSHISADGATATVSDQLGFFTLGIDDIRAERIAPQLIDSSEPYLGEAQVVGGEILEHVYNYFADENRFDSYLVLTGSEANRVLFGAKGSSALVMSFSVSPNEQYVAIEVDPGLPGGSDDEYIGSSRPTDVTTYVVEIATGDVVASVAGFDVEW